MVMRFSTFLPDQLGFGSAPRPGRYTLLAHAHALQRLLPVAAEQGVEMIVGGPYNSGILAGGSHSEYQEAPDRIIQRVRHINVIADVHGVNVEVAALPFSPAHPVAAAIIPGAAQPSRIAEDREAVREEIPPTSGGPCATPTSSAPTHRSPEATER
jgi:D-threo-aldose 1-dehydrogenase